MPISNEFGRRAVVGVLLCGVLCVGIGSGLASIRRAVNISLAANELQRGDGVSFVVSVKNFSRFPWTLPGDTVEQPTRSDLRLLEDGIALDPAHCLHATIRQLGAGRYSHWVESIVFSTSDNSDPRTNGRNYSAIGTVRLVGPIVNFFFVTGGALVAAASATLVWIYRRQIVARTRRSGASLWARLWARRWDYFLGGAFPLMISFSACVFLPPMWNGTDSIGWMVWQRSQFPHFPILYPAFTALASIPFREPSALILFSNVMQHLFVTAAIIYVSSAYRERWKILVTSILSTVGVAFTLYAHGFFTEALDLPFLLILLGAVLRLEAGRIRYGVALALFAGLLGGELTRHASVVYSLIPVTFAVLAVVLAKGRGSTASWVSVAQVFGVVLLASVTAGLTTRVACDVLQSKCISIIGRAGVYRVRETYTLVPTERREAWLEGLARSAPDRETGRAIALMAEAPSPWAGARDAIAQEPDLKAFDPDVLMNRAFWSYALSLDRYVLKQWGEELSKAILGEPYSACCAYEGQVGRILANSGLSISTYFPKLPKLDLYRKLLVGTGANDPKTAQQYYELARLPATKVADSLLPLTPWLRGILLAVSGLLACAAVWVAREDRVAATLGGLVAGFVGYVIALTFVTIEIARYLAPLDVMIWVGNSVALIGLTEGLLSRFRQQSLRGAT